MLPAWIVAPWGNAHAQDQVLIFSAMGDVPYGSSEVPTLQRQIRDHNKYSPADFMVHIGDIKSGSSSCTEALCRDMAGWMRALAVPTYILPGDNETTDCSNPSQAWTYWARYFTDFDAGFCGAPVTAHQSVRHENWSFITKGVLCLGIDLPSPPSSVNQTVWNVLLQQDADWVSQQLRDRGAGVRAAVLFSQDGPGDSHQNLFFTQFRAAAATFAKPLLLLHGDDHTWKLDHPFAEANILRACVNNGGEEDPVQVTVTLDSRNPFTLLRNPWSSSPVVYDAPPCVDAGPDLAVTLPAAASLNARSTDDGDPAPPGRLTLGWTTTSGPAPAVFANPTAAATTASFTAPGAYVLRLTADDGPSHPWDEVAVNVIGSGPILSIADAQTTEGNSNSTDAVFTVTLANGDGSTIDVDWSTSAGSAAAGIDYTPVSGTLQVTGTSDSRTIRVPVTGDTDVELDETFAVNLTHASAGTVARAQAVGTIVNDDTGTPPPPPPAAGVVTLLAVQDSKVNSSSGSSTYGAATTLRVKTDSETYDSFLKFNISGLAGPVQSAVLRLYCTDASDHAGFAYRVADTYRNTTTPWIETGINFKNAPFFAGAPLNAAVAAPANAWVPFDVTAAVTGNGTYSFGIHSPSGNSAYYSSKEGAHPPELIVTTGTTLAMAARDDNGGGGTPAAATRLPAQLELGRGFPNPTRGLLTIEFALPRPATVTVAVFDVRGRLVRRIDAGERAGGPHDITWDGDDTAGRQVGSGVYYLHLQAGGETARMRVTVLR